MARDLGTQGMTYIEFPEFCYSQLGVGEANNTGMPTDVDQKTDTTLPAKGWPSLARLKTCRQ